MRVIRSLLAVLLLGAVLALPTLAQARVADSYRGWAYVVPSDGNSYAPAFRWIPDWGWNSVGRWRAEQIWVQPFATGWSWTWNQSRGWLAMRPVDISVSANEAASGVRGRITYGPLCPVEPCTLGPSPVRLTFLQQVGIFETPKMVQVMTDVNGNYSAPLVAGSYYITASVGIGWSAYVTVPAGGWIVRNYSIDTGIR